jgi:hypothetical protein
MRTAIFFFVCLLSTIVLRAQSREMVSVWEYAMLVQKTHSTTSSQGSKDSAQEEREPPISKEEFVWARGTEQWTSSTVRDLDAQLRKSDELYHAGLSQDMIGLLNDLGARNWELVAVVHEGVAGADESTAYYFKRPRLIGKDMY